ncbi:alpha/beta hydrolase [Paenibacillus sp. J22TS3]|uniref:alpha/beta hydrolase n=1 Tax=Paenibacillus sp. J22TS3 TaxID=2807192 RepID=UPI001B07B309|nr:alpha/beta hydrolase-fold protein [Paenibacillus sp. J22TS3]GIP22116.1 ferri-bacillibactin esterase BesA [Paenibacillus sp. J22TS3]
MSRMTANPYVPDRCFEYRMTSGKQLEYRIMISIPADEPPPDGYAVIYALDGDAVFQTLVETVRLQTRKPKGFGPILVVGIGYPSKEPFDADRRCRDFTMQTGNASLPVRPDGSPWPPHGEAEDFLDFLEHELKPAISQEWPVDPSRQAIVGHSLGGLFTLHALFTRTHLFTHYVAGSPSTWWAENLLFKELDSFTEVWKGECPVHLLLTIGADELPDMLEGAEQVAQRLRPFSGKGVRMEWVKFADENHVSVLPSALGRIPRFLWTNSTDI